MATPVNILVILGTVRQERRSERVARWLLNLLAESEGVEVQLIDIRDLSMSLDDAGRGTADPHFATSVEACDGIIIVVPEYNGGYPGLLKHALDTLLHEYKRKAAGIVGVSVGSLGGARMIPTLVPVLRSVGMVSINRDLLISRVEEALDSDGKVMDSVLPGRAQRFIEEMLWMSRALKTARENLDL